LCPETEIGARNRINEMLRHGLPVISTIGAEITHILKSHHAGVICESRNSDDLSHSILALAQDKEKRESIKKEGETLIKTRFSATITQKPLLEWLKSPARAPDNGKAVPLKQKLHFLTSGREYYRQRGMKSFLQKCKQKVHIWLGL